MSAPEIRGWCPGALRPMLSGDGYVVRVKPRAGRLSAGQARTLADLAMRHGDGAVGLTQRANLQIRGVSEAAVPKLQADLAAAGLLDADAGIEARRNVIVSPFDEGGVSDRIATALEAALASNDCSALPAKFGFAVDAAPGGRRLADAPGDVRIERSGAALIVRADGCATGRAVPDAAAAVAGALALSHWFAGTDREPRGRMARHLAAGATLPAALAGDAVPDPARPAVAPGPGAGGLSVAAAFGQLPAGALRTLADWLPQDGALRVTPFRTLFIADAGDRAAAAAAAGFVTDPDDPRLRIVTCAGAPGCTQAGGPTRALAARLAARVPCGALWHVSGCAKGCAHPRPAETTVVARDGRYDLVAGGAPWDEPDRRGMDTDAVLRALAGR